MSHLARRPHHWLTSLTPVAPPWLPWRPKIPTTTNVLVLLLSLVAGADLKDIADLDSAGARSCRYLENLCVGMAAVRKPLIAAVNGPAVRTCHPSHGLLARPTTQRDRRPAPSLLGDLNLHELCVYHSLAADSRWP